MSKNYNIGRFTQRPKLFCKWWLKTRPCKNTVQTCIEFYVPFWAWPFELLHRAFFGSVKFINT